MGANIAGIYGAQIFRQDDRPRYRRGFSVNIGVLTFALCLAIIRYLDDVRRRRRNVRLAQDESGSEIDQVAQNEKGAVVAPPSEDQPQTVLLGAGRKPVVSNGLE